MTLKRSGSLGRKGIMTTSILQGFRIVVGLIKGRHELPVTSYIFDEVKDVLDFKAMGKYVYAWLEENVGFKCVDGSCLNQTDWADVAVRIGKADLTVYVTGLTAVTACLIWNCALNGANLTLMHYDNGTGKYVPQEIFYSGF